MEDMVKVSLVLPSLNVGKYIGECIESAINQTLQEIEIICVDAGSTDGTLEIIEEYAERDSRIQVIKSDQKSYGHQMNLGIGAAKGEYIGILETDDIAPPEMYEELYEVAYRNRVDLVKADFYRFTGSGDNMKKDLIRVTGKKSDAYNKVIDVSKEKGCFNFVMNTWSGIYSRKFLLENEIWHHETPGASFQDNGFWFQTFMKAKRAYFVNKAYYMNRRDREDSSVFNSKNIYAICEEYDWLEEKLKSVPGCYEEFGPLHAYFAFRNYKWTLDRIMYADKAEFYSRLRKKLEGYHKAGIIDYSIFREFNENMALSLWAILNRSEEYYAEFYQDTERIIEEIPEERPVFIYGAGKVGKDCLDGFLKTGRKDQVKYFAVTKASGDEEPYQGVPVFGIDELTAWKDDAAVILAVKPSFRREMLMNLLRLGFRDIREWPDLEYVLRDKYPPEVQFWQKKLENGYVFPYDKVQKGSKILIYGGSDVAMSYYWQMEMTGYANVVQWVVTGSSDYQRAFPVELPEAIGNIPFDYAVVAYEDVAGARKAGWELLTKGVPEERLVWSSQSMEVAKQKLEADAQRMRFELEDYLGMKRDRMREELRREKEYLLSLTQASSRVLPKVVLQAASGIGKAMSDFISLMEKADACISLRIYMGNKAVKEDIMEILSFMPEDKKIFGKKIVLVDPLQLAEDVCECLAGSNIGVIIIYTDYNLFHSRDGIMENLERFQVQSECFFDYSCDSIAKAQADAILLDDGKIYECAEECIYKKDFCKESAEYESEIETFSFEKLFKGRVEDEAL